MSKLKYYLLFDLTKLFIPIPITIEIKDYWHNDLFDSQILQKKIAFHLTFLHF